MTKVDIITIYRHMLQLADGGQLAMDWLNMGTEDGDLPVLVIMPGLTGQWLILINYFYH